MSESNPISADDLKKCMELQHKLKRQKRISRNNSMKYYVKLLNFNVITDGNSFIIQMFGLDKERKTYSINVKNMKPFFYVKIDDGWEEEDCSNFIGDIVSDMVNA